MLAPKISPGPPFLRPAQPANGDEAKEGGSFVTEQILAIIDRPTDLLWSQFVCVYEG